MNLLEEDNEPQIDPNKDYLSELVGEGKKFKTNQDLAKGKVYGDAHSKTLEKKLDQLREDYLKLDTDYKAREKLEELIGQLNKPVQPPLSNNQPIVNDDKKPEIDAKQIESLIDTQIKKNKILDKESENFNKAKDRLREAFGSNYQTSLNERIEDLELTVDDVNAMARKSPEAFARMLGIDKPAQKDGFQTPPRSSVRNDNFSPKGGPKRTWSYYQDLKKSNPKLYYDPKINIQMEKDYLALGEAFEDGDFHS